MTERHYPPDLCDAEEMAYLLSMGRTTFLNNVDAGLISAGVKIGGKRLWNRHRVIAEIEGRQHREANPPLDDIMEAAARVGKAKETRREAAPVRS